MIQANIPFANEFKGLILANVSINPLLSFILDALQSGNLALAVVLTFLVNLTFGAFSTTTFPGVIPLLGGVWALVISSLRGFVLGIAYYDVLQISIGYSIVGIGTLLLEVGAYVFSAAAGINISLSTVFPSRNRVVNKWVAFKESWKDASSVYVIVIILLGIGALWEMIGLYVLGV
jgi:hypothetical protein